MNTLSKHLNLLTQRTAATAKAASFKLNPVPNGEAPVEGGKQQRAKTGDQAEQAFSAMLTPPKPLSPQPARQKSPLPETIPMGVGQAAPVHSKPDAISFIEMASDAQPIAGEMPLVTTGETTEMVDLPTTLSPVVSERPSESARDIIEQDIAHLADPRIDQRPISTAGSILETVRAPADPFAAQTMPAPAATAAVPQVKSAEMALGQEAVTVERPGRAAPMGDQVATTDMMRLGTGAPVENPPAAAINPMTATVSPAPHPAGQHPSPALEPVLLQPSPAPAGDPPPATPSILETRPREQVQQPMVAQTALPAGPFMAAAAAAPMPQARTPEISQRPILAKHDHTPMVPVGSQTRVAPPTAEPATITVAGHDRAAVQSPPSQTAPTPAPVYAPPASLPPASSPAAQIPERIGTELSTLNRSQSAPAVVMAAPYTNPPGAAAKPATGLTAATAVSTPLEAMPPAMPSLVSAPATDASPLATAAKPIAAPTATAATATTASAAPTPIEAMLPAAHSSIAAPAPQAPLAPPSTQILERIGTELAAVNRPQPVPAGMVPAHNTNLPSTFTMQLNPAGLGSVTVKMGMQEGQLSITILFENSRTLDRFGNDMEALRLNLRGAGLPEAQVQIAQLGSSSSNTTGGGQTAFQGGEQTSGGQNRMGENAERQAPQERGDMERRNQGENHDETHRQRRRDNDVDGRYVVV